MVAARQAAEAGGWGFHSLPEPGTGLPGVRSADRPRIDLAGLVVSVIGFSVVIWQQTRAANAREEHQASHRAA
jgi:hypothetical protein